MACFHPAGIVHIADRLLAIQLDTDREAVEHHALVVTAGIDPDVGQRVVDGVGGPGHVGQEDAGVRST